MTKAILFDFWGTLVENGIWSPIKQIKNILNIDLPFSDYVIRMETILMAQEFKELRDAFIAVCQEFNIQPSEEILERLIGLWNKNWMLAQPYPETEIILKELKKKHQIILIANTDCFSIPQVLEKFHLTDLFDQIFLSYQLGAIKTDKSFLKNVLTKIDLTPEDCLVVGDSIQSDIMSAKRAGINAVLIDRKNTRDYHPKIKNLKDLEKVI
jgi:putative hydrolase of the HAD superfamily